MTIKPVIAPTQKQRGVGGNSGNSNTADTEKKETLGQVVGEQDAHGQSRSDAVYEELTRSHRRSPHKSPRIKRRDHHEQHAHGHGHSHSHSHSHGHHLHKRGERSGVEKLTTNVNAVVNAAGNIIPKCQSPHSSTNVGGLGLASSSLSGGSVAGLNSGSGNNSPAHNNNLSSMGSLNSIGIGKASPEHLSAAARSVLGLGCSAASAKSPTSATSSLLKAIEDTYSGYNSGDEHLHPKEDAISLEEWQRRDEQFAKCMQERDFILKNVEEDGACLFRAISLQIYGDEDMHDVIRQHTMDYIYKNREYFSHFVTEDINSYIKRKRRKDSHGNHIEIQAMSEIYNRPVEVYCYKPKPINIFNSEQLKNGYAPLRLSYQRGSHYNAIIDPYNATVGVGLGLAGYKPDLQTKEAARLSEQLEIEQTMFEDKLKTTDWEATNEAIEEQIARESYLQWCRDNLQRSRNSTATSSTSATITSAEAMDAANAAPSHQQYAFMPRNGYTLSSGGGGPTSSTITSGAVLSMALSALPSATATSASEGEGVSTLAATNQILGAALASVTAGGGCVSGGNAGGACSLLQQSQNELGYASDDTDMSSTSSVSYHSSGTGGDKSPSTIAAQKQRSKKTKSRANNTPVRTHKKRRCEQQQQQQQTAKSTAGEAEIGTEGGNGNKSPTVTRQSPKLQTRSRSPTPEQQPCTSKQSNTPEKQQQQQQQEEATEQQEATEQPAAVEKQPESDKQQQQQEECEEEKQQPVEEEKSAAQKNSPARNQSFTSFYQELLEASYATDGFGQLSESEMLQRAIQMSTQDYIQDQQRKYLYGP